MSKLHLCLVKLDLPMLQETRISGYNIFKTENILCHLFGQFEDCGEFKKQLGGGEGKLIINDETMRL